ETKLAAWALLVSRVREDAALHERAVRVGHERPDVAVTVRQALRLVFALDPGVPLPDGLLPPHVVALVDGVRVAALGAFEVGVRKEEFADRRVEREAVHPVAGGERQRRGA